VITYCCFYIYSYIGQLIEKRRYERKVAKKLLQNYQVDLSDRATNVKKRILSEDYILDMISKSKKTKTTMSLDSLNSSQQLLQLTRKVRIYIIMLFVKKLHYLYFTFCLFLSFKKNGEYFRQKLCKYTSRKQFQRLRNEIETTCKCYDISLRVKVKLFKYHQYIVQLSIILDKLQSPNLSSKVQIPQINKNYTAMLHSNTVDEKQRSLCNKH